MVVGKCDTSVGKCRQIWHQPRIDLRRLESIKHKDQYGGHDSPALASFDIELNLIGGQSPNRALVRFFQVSDSDWRDD